ncbi:serine-rich adhesin for platelets-like [Haliotis asinina]|uniref:serine-rich adhesin for platelets-like n=1 Tax=Haliotis asinina TaxID=109174 RepID=UPI0035326C00
MSILKVYLNWANSVLSEVGHYVEGVSAVQDGRVLCDLIDILTNSAGLVDKVQKNSSEESTPQQWIQAALDHMRHHGIKYTFTVQDILDGDIKSLLDVLWLIILNYSLHKIDQNAYQRSVGIGKKHLMEWCEMELATQFDSRNTFAFNLCQGNWFSRLLQKFIGDGPTDDQDRVAALTKLLDTVEYKYYISRDIISAADIIDGTVDEHTLMIYVALLRRRVGGDNKILNAFSKFTKPPGGMNLEVANAMRSQSPSPQYKAQDEEDRYVSSDSELCRADHMKKKQSDYILKPMSVSSYKSNSIGKGPSAFAARKHGSAEELSDWMSSSSLVSVHSERNVLNHSPNDDGPISLNSDGESMLKETISQRVYEHMPQSENEADKDVDTLTHRLDDLQAEASRCSSAESIEKDAKPFPASFGSPLNSKSGNITDGRSEKTSGVIKIKRPKDYFLQWEETLDRLSQGPSSSSDIIQSSRSQSDLDLESLSGRSRSSSRSRSRSHESRPSLHDSIVHKSLLDRERGRPSENMFRSKSHSQPDSMTKYKQARQGGMVQDRRTYTPDNQSSKLTASTEKSASTSDVNLASMSGTKISDLQSHPMFPNLKSLLSSIDPQRLDILNKSGEPPDVLTLLDNIKKARLAVDNNMPKEGFRSRRTQDKKDQTNFKDVYDPRTEGRDESAVSQRLGEEVKQDTSPSSGHLQDLSVSGSETIRRRSPLRRTPGRHTASSPRLGSPTVVSPHRLLEHKPDLHDEDHLYDSDSSYSHLPRREAWERSRGGRDLPVDGSRIDSLAQAKFIEVLCKEIEELKYKIETIEGSGESSPVARSISRGERTTPTLQLTGTKIDPLSQFSDIHEHNGHMVFESSRSRSLSPIYTRQRKSPDLPRRISQTGSRYEGEVRRNSPNCTRSRSLSPTLEKQRDIENKLRDRISPDRFNGSSDRYIERSVPDSTHGVSPSRYASTMDSMYMVENYQTQYSPRTPSPSHGPSRDRLSPVRGFQRGGLTLHEPGDSPRAGSHQSVDPDDQTRAISLGYSSPVRSVTQEIWGNKLSIVKGLEPERQDRWKNLIAMRELSDEDVIELKQALASCIVENDILQAKLRNAKADVSEKLFKTNDVLDDCRRHLSKSQAENMELRSNLEHARHKSEELGARVKSMEDSVFKARAESDQMRMELQETGAALNKALGELRPLEDLKQVNQSLRMNLSQVESQNDSLRQDFEEMQFNQEKAQSTIKELRTCLEEVRQERSKLFDEINALHVSNQKSKVADIISHYTEKGACDEVDREIRRGTSSQPSSRPSSASRSRTSSMGCSSRPDMSKIPTRRSRIDDYISPSRENVDSSLRVHRRTSTWNSELDSSPVKLNSSLNMSSTLDSKDTGYSTEEMMQSPGVPSSFREIYPHRKVQYYRDKQREALDHRLSPIPFVDYSDLQQYPTKLSYSDYDAEDSYRISRKGFGETGSFRENLLQRQHRDSLHGDNYTDDLSRYESSQNYGTGKDMVETVVESSSTTYQRPASDVTERLSQSMQETLRQPHHDRKESSGRLNVSYNSVYDMQNRKSPSSKKGILKNGKTEQLNHLRERSCSPVLQRYGRSHSPPTKLSPSNNATMETKSGLRRPLYGRSSSARRVTTKLNDELDGGRESNLKAGYSRAKSWYQLQLLEPTVLSDAQRRYADHLIEKYTGQRADMMDTF